MTRRLAFVFALLSGLALVQAPRLASAQEIQITGPLAGAPACHHCRIFREGRVQLMPFAAFTLVDEFTRTIPLGLQATYHFTDWLGIGAWGAWGGISVDTGLTEQVTAQGQTTSRNRLSLPSREGFPDQIGHLNLMFGAHLTFIPLRGKLSLFQKLFVDSDFYIFLGAAAIQVEERADVAPGVCGASATTPCSDSQSERATRFAIAPSFGVGLTLYATDFFALSFEWRGMPFAWNTSGTDEGGADGDFPDGIIDSNDQIFHFNHMAVVGFSFYLPTSPKVSE